MLIDYEAMKPRFLEFSVDFSAFDDVTPRDVAYRLAEITQEEAEHRRRARKRAWAAIRDWVRNIARNHLGPTASMAVQAGG